MAPDGKPLIGSGAAKLFDLSPRVYAERICAPLILMVRPAQTDLQRQARAMAEQWGFAGPNGDGDLCRRWAASVVEDAKTKRWMDTGAAIEHYLFPTAGDPLPAMSKKDLEAAEVRAWRIGKHAVAGPYFGAEGSTYQIAHMWQDSASGLWLRMREDCCYTSRYGPAVFDLKIWSQLDRVWSMRKKIISMGAATQAAIYQRGEMDLWGHKNDWSLIISGPGVSDKIMVRRLGKDLIRVADEKLSRTLDDMAKAYETSVFHDANELPQEVN
jgi:hypothetical protein